MAMEEMLLYGSCILLAKSSAASDKNKTVRVTSVSSSTQWTGTLTGTVPQYRFVLPNRDKYKVELMSGTTVLYTTYVTMGFGDFIELEVGLDKTTWAGVKKIIDAGQASTYIHTGDRFTVPLSNGETLVYLANVNVYGLGEVDFIPTYCLATAMQYYSSYTIGTGWSGSHLREYLNSGFKSMLPADLQSVISDKPVKTTPGGTDSIVTTYDKIWIPTEKECAYPYYSYPAEYNAGLHYPVFTDDASRTRTQGKNGAVTAWWLASIANGTNYIMFIAGNGSLNYGRADSYLGILPCFRIAPST